jgi:signal transduction histidine kinase
MNEDALHVLLVEDNVEDADLLRAMFRKGRADNFVLTHLLSMTEAVHRLAEGGVDLILLDLGLPDGSGIDTVRRARAAAPDVPVIVLTGLDDEQLAAEAMKAGAQDYLIKGQIENRALPRAMRYAIERHEMQVETDLIRRQQLQFKDEFLSHVSHELRSPLTAIYQFATIIADGLAGPTNAEQTAHLEIIVRNTRQLKSMIDDLLEVARVQAGKLTIEPQCIGVADAINYSIETLRGNAAAKAIALGVDMPLELPTVYADPTRLRQILNILLDNAIKFTPANGTVSLHVRMAAKDPGVLLFEVADTGCGIAADVIERVFDRLCQAPDASQAGRNGLGLGLYICRELVLRQGGEISARSTAGAGATFAFTLPIFSLDALIEPTVRVAARHTTSIALIVIQVDSSDGCFSPELRADTSRRIRELLMRGLRSDLDVLLPSIGGPMAEGLFFIIAVADGIGGEAIAKRVRDQLYRYEQIHRAGLSSSVSYRLLAPPLEAATGITNESIGNVSVDIQSLVNDEVMKRTFRDEQENHSGH